MDAVLTAGLDPEGSEEFVKAIVVGQLEAAGMELTNENIAAFTTLLEGQLAGMEMFSQAIQTTLVVTQAEDGAWLICSPIQGRMPRQVPRSPRPHRPPRNGTRPPRPHHPLTDARPDRGGHQRSSGRKMPRIRAGQARDRR